MKNKIVNGIALAAMTAFVIACTPKKEETATATAVDKDQIKTELQAMEDGFAAAYNAGKPEDMVYYANDATNYSQNKPPTVGKAAIDSSIKEDIAAIKGTKIALAVVDVFPSSDGNQVVEIGSYKMTDSTNTTTASGHYMSLFEKRDGKYRCIRDMGASDMPKEEKK